MPGLDDITGEGVQDDELLVYIAGPYTHGRWEDNIIQAIEIAQQIWMTGHTPFLPHTMTSLWSLLYPKNQWIRLDLKWLEQCDALIRIEGKSEGADTEVEFAEESGIPVYNTPHEFLVHHGERRRR